MDRVVVKPSRVAWDNDVMGLLSDIVIIFLLLSLITRPISTRPSNIHVGASLARLHVTLAHVHGVLLHLGYIILWCRVRHVCSKVIIIVIIISSGPLALGTSFTLTFSWCWGWRSLPLACTFFLLVWFLFTVLQIFIGHDHVIQLEITLSILFIILLIHPLIVLLTLRHPVHTHTHTHT